MMTKKSLPHNSSILFLIRYAHYSNKLTIFNLYRDLAEIVADHQALFYAPRSKKLKSLGIDDGTISEIQERGTLSRG